MGARPAGADALFCEMPGCGRKAYVTGEEGMMCHVCDCTFLNELMSQSAQKLACCSPARQSSAAPFQKFLQNPVVAKLCMEFLHGDGWEKQCLCTHCKREWLNTGWACPVEYRWHMYLQMLERIFLHETSPYSMFDLQYVDWEGAVRRLHDMYTDEIPWDDRALHQFARLSACKAHAELGEMFDKEFPWDELRGNGTPDAP